MICIVDAGYEGILYPSTKGDCECVAVFPHRLANDASFVSATDAAPESITHTRLDLSTADDLCGFMPGIRRWRSLKPEYEGRPRMSLE